MRHKLFTMLFATSLATLPAYARDFDPKAFIAAHNKWRAEVGVPQAGVPQARVPQARVPQARVIGKLSYSLALAVSAQAWADNLKQTNHCQMRHSNPDGKYGENLYWGSAMNWSDGRKELQKLSPQQVVDSWGSEKQDYDYASNSCTPGKMCGHYTQMVWRTTRTVGCAMAVCEDSKQQVWVCQYKPAGNWVGNKPY